MLNVDTPNPAHATIKKLLSDPVDALLRPPGGWKRPDNLLGALAETIAENQGDSRAARRPRLRGSTSATTRSATRGCATWATPSQTARRPRS